MYHTHKWSGWPGAYCLVCLNDDAFESALGCPDCELIISDEDVLTSKKEKLCPMHEAWVNTLASGCPPDHRLVQEFNSNYPLDKE